MCNKFKDISMKSHMHYFFDNVINIKHFDPTNIKINEQLYKKYSF